MNKYNLTRDIPSPIKRTVRKRCGFGCVVCGCAIIQYHHFNPEFVDAKMHNPKGITLLCPNCHEKTKKKIFNSEFISDRDADPECKKVGYTRDIFHMGKRISGIQMGQAHFKGLDVIRYEKNKIISFSQAPNGNISLNAKFHDKNGKPLLTIIENEWKVGVENFDLETDSNNLIIRERLGLINFHLVYGAEQKLYIKRLNMNFNGCMIQVIDDQFSVESPTKAKIHIVCPNIYAAIILCSNGDISVG